MSFGEAVVDDWTIHLELLEDLPEADNLTAHSMLLGPLETDQPHTKVNLSSEQIGYLKKLNAEYSGKKSLKWYTITSEFNNHYTTTYTLKQLLQKMNREKIKNKKEQNTVTRRETLSLSEDERRYLMQLAESNKQQNGRIVWGDVVEGFKNEYNMEIEKELLRELLSGIYHRLVLKQTREQTQEQTQEQTHEQTQEQTQELTLTQEQFNDFNCFVRKQLLEKPGFHVGTEDLWNIVKRKFKKTEGFGSFTKEEYKTLWETRGWYHEQDVNLAIAVNESKATVNWIDISVCVSRLAPRTSDECESRWKALNSHKGTNSLFLKMSTSPPCLSYKGS
jgi:hypothetical protein